MSTNGFVRSTMQDEVASLAKEEKQDRLRAQRKMLEHAKAEAQFEQVEATTAPELAPVIKDWLYQPRGKGGVLYSRPSWIYDDGVKRTGQKRILVFKRENCPRCGGKCSKGHHYGVVDYGEAEIGHDRGRRDANAHHHVLSAQAAKSAQDKIIAGDGATASADPAELSSDEL